MNPIDVHRDDHPDDQPDDQGQRERAADERLSAQLAGLRPVQPGPELRARIAAELARAPREPVASSPRRPLAAIGERLAWAAGGAAAASLAFLLAGAVPAGREPAAVATVAATGPAEPVAVRSAQIREEPVRWSDEGIRFVDEFTPARVLRRSVIERHMADDGAAEVQVPREDVIFLPVALR